MSKTALRILIGGLILVALIGLGFFAYRALRPGPAAAVNTQYLAYEKLSQASQTPLELTLQNGFPRGVVGQIHVEGATPAERAQVFLDEYGDFYQQSDPNLELHLRRVGGLEGEDVLFYQTYAGIPVYGVEFLVSLHGEDVFATAGGLLPGGVELDIIPGLAPQDAEALARTALGQPEDAPIFGLTELVVYEPSISSDSPFDPHLAWRVTIGDRDPRVALVDAHDGTLLFQFGLIDSDTDGYDLDLEDANGANGSDTSCYWDTTDDDQVGDEDELYDEADFSAEKLYNFSWQAYLFYHSTFGRHSYDGDDGQLEIYEHASVDNADWLGASVDCDLIEFSDGWVAYDVFVHEFTHGVIDFTSNFNGAGQPGALNESYADIMASLADGNWTMGEAVVNGPIRSLSNPPAYNQPDQMSEIYTGSDDDYGEHVNTGIPSYAYYLIAAGGTHPDTNIEVNALGSGAMSSLAYNTMVSLGSGSMFIDARNASVGKAAAWWDALSVCQVRNAFYAVGLGNPDIDCNGTEDNPDPDNDGLPFGQDNCPFLANPAQVDIDQDGLGSGCDYDDNANGILDSYETALANPYNLCPTPGGPCDLDNYDGDNYVNDEDNCPWDVNNGQEDEDNDGEGDICDPDYDDDGWSNDNDDCPFTADPGQEDSDGDGAGDACDPTPDCADVVAWSTGIELPNGESIPPHPIGDPLKCPERYTVDGSAIALNDLLSPGGGGRQIDLDGEGGMYAKLPLPLCPPDEDALSPDYRGQLMLGELDPGIRAWIARDDGMAVSNDRTIGDDRVLRFHPEGGFDYHLVLALFGIGEGDKTMFSVLMDCGPDLPPPAEATGTSTPVVTETPTPTPTPAPAAFGDPRPSAGAFFYGRNTCGPMQVMIDVQLMGGDPTAGPYDAVMFFRLAEMNGPGRSEWSAMAMNPVGDDMFTETLDSESDIPGFNMWVSSWLQVQFVAEDAQGVEIARSPVFPMLSELARCPR